MTQDDIGEKTARLLLETGSVRVSRGRHFTLAAGWASPVYIDCRLLIGAPASRRAITDLAIAATRQRFDLADIGAIAGAETAGIPFAAWLADGLDLPLRYVRKRPLGIGHNAQVEGGSVEGVRVLLMDDLTTDAGSKVAFVRGLRAAGATVTNALTIFYHNAFPGAAERLAEADLALHPMATWADILRAADGKTLAAEDRTEIERFLADPIEWSTRHGGRSAMRPQRR